MFEAVTVIIPALNEESSIESVISAVKRIVAGVACKYEIIVIDDGSTDGTLSCILKNDVTVIHHEKTIGYGASIKEGIYTASNENIVIIDSDGTYPANRIPDLLKTLETADMAVGARIGHNVNIPLMRRPAKWILRILAEYITSQKIPDLNSGFRAFRKSLVMEYMPILSDEFSFTTSVTVALLSHKYVVRYIPIDYFKRVGKSKVMPRQFIDFVILVLRLSMRFNPLKVFVPIALACFFVGALKFCFDIYFAFYNIHGITVEFLTRKVVSQTTLMLWLAGLQIMLVGMVADGIILKVVQPYRSKRQFACKGANAFPHSSHETLDQKNDSAK